ncbi:MAG: methyltransferase type 12 [Adhaeribacter sp.]|nr:methyltransferase type 12 [Adhaeribacter sp.]
MFKPGFDRIAPLYDFLASLVFGKAIQRAQTKFLNFIPAQSNILVIGGGTGWILPAILNQTLPARIVYLEASAKMLQLARQKVKNLNHAASIEFRLGTENDIELAEKFEVIISNFFLDLFLPAELENIITTLHRSLRAGGVWLVADFVYPPGAGLRPAGARLLLKSMYAFFRFTAGISAQSLPDWEDMLAQLPLIEQESAPFYGGLIKSKVYHKK